MAGVLLYQIYSLFQGILAVIVGNEMCIRDRDKYTTIVSIFFIVTLLLSLYYYRPLSMEDVLDNDKYRTLMESSTEIEAEEVINSSLVDTCLLYTSRCV